MQTRYRVQFIALTLLLLSTSILRASEKIEPGSPPSPRSVSDHVNYQGYLTDISGAPLEGSHTIVFRIYDSATGGTELWAESHTVTISGGIFNVLLGHTTPIASVFASGTERHLALEVDATTLSPRIELGAVGYALNAAAVDGNDVAALDGRYVNHGEANSIEGGMILDGAITMSKIASAGATTGQVIKWNGTAWAPQADDTGAADTDWTITGNDMYSGVTGNVGIGTSTPGSKLEVIGNVEVASASGDHSVLLANTGGDHGEVRVFTSSMLNPAVNVDAKDTGDGGAVKIRNSEDEMTVKIQGAQSTGSGGLITMTNGTGTETAVIDGELGTLLMRNSTGGLTALVEADESGGSRIKLYNGNLVSEPTIEIDAEEGTNSGGAVTLRNGTADATIKIDGDGPSHVGSIVLLAADGSDAISLTGYSSFLGGSVVSTDVLEVNGADVSEQFDIVGDGVEVQAGMVVAIDSRVPGQLAVCNRSYDTKVAGVVSGAGGIRPGMLLGQRDTLADGDYPVAMSGRIYCWADASYGAIALGDLLTTSETPGHARKVENLDRARGATIGKAMTELREGTGLVLVLVGLQ